MTRHHLIVSPHPDDAAFSCGGLIARLRDKGEAVTILTVFSGFGSASKLTPFQRLALGFGQGPGPTPTPQEVMATRRVEDEEFARVSGAKLIRLDLPDAVFRDYVGDEGLMGAPRDNDVEPYEELRGPVKSANPDRLYLPFAIGGHVDHRQVRGAALAILNEESRLCDRTIFYEDFPYSVNYGFEDPKQLDGDFWSGLPRGSSLTPEYVKLDGLLDRKLDGIRVYGSQLGRTFKGEDRMERQLRERAEYLGGLARTGLAERYWRLVSA